MDERTNEEKLLDKISSLESSNERLKSRLDAAMNLISHDGVEITSLYATIKSLEGAIVRLAESQKEQDQ